MGKAELQFFLNKNRFYNNMSYAAPQDFFISFYKIDKVWMVVKNKNPDSITVDLYKDTLHIN